MANKHGGLLATLGKRMLGLSTSSSGCCAAPADVAATSENREAGGNSPEVNTQRAGCCSPSPCASTKSAGQDAQPSA
jgi:hypothetical protein